MFTYFILLVDYSGPRAVDLENMTWLNETNITNIIATRNRTLSSSSLSLLLGGGT